MSVLNSCCESCCWPIDVVERQSCCFVATVGSLLLGTTPIATFRPYSCQGREENAFIAPFWVRWFLNPTAVELLLLNSFAVELLNSFPEKAVVLLLRLFRRSYG